MTVLTVRTLGDPVLRTVCEPVTNFDDEIGRLVDDMIETMFEVEGVGLAAPQIGVSLRLFTYGVEGRDGEVGHVINPVLEVGEEPQEGGEGCLSVPGLSSDTPRRHWARVTGVDKNNRPVVVEGEGLLARCLQHETDHLDGKLYIDRLVGDDKKRIMKAIRAADYRDVAAGVERRRAGTVSSGFAAGSSFGKGSAFGGSALGGRS
ncbi:MULTISPECIES: peptide deformylase [Kocuria]|uniref:peptide deformylase n=1 Tax=Kocuria TaxID=57493 RepID=UPI00066116B3|nr:MULTISPECIES: peptide deformylase [Kocuria]MCT1366680.1 peptide deformylase [Rothia sp. p3-SID1597]RUQ22720.1 peptide deformylase [Kocuria sp. HSID16901]